MRVTFDYENVIGRFSGIPQATQDDALAMLVNGIDVNLWLSKRNFPVDSVFDKEKIENMKLIGKYEILATRPPNYMAWLLQNLGSLKYSSNDIIINTLFPALDRNAKHRILRIHDPLGIGLSFLKELKSGGGRLKLVLARSLRTAALAKVIDNTNFVSVSNVTKDKIVDLYRIDSSRIAVIPNAVGFSFKLNVNRQPHENKPYFLIIGGYRQRKRPNYAINAWANSKILRETNLIVVGDVPYELLNESAKIRYEKRELRFVKNLTHESLNCLLANALASIFVSLGEGFGRPIAESLMVGTSVISNDLPIFREVGGSFVDYFDINFPEQLQSLLEEKIENKNIQDKDKMMKFASKYSYESIGLSWARYLSNLTSN